MVGPVAGWSPLGTPPVAANPTPVPTASPAPVAGPPLGATSMTLPAAAPVDAVGSEAQAPAATPQEILAAARAAALEANKVWLKGWQDQNPWNTSFPPPKPAKKPARALWAAPKPLSNRQKGQLKRLLSAGFKPAYARQLVERGDTMWINIMARNPVKRRR